LDQRDWDEYAEGLTFAINTARDRIRGEIPIYMIQDWDPRFTLEAVVPVGSTRRHDRDPRRWRYRMQNYYAVRLEVAGSTYSIFPVVHVSKIKLVKIFPDRPVARLNESEGDRVDFDEALLPDDSWIQDRCPDEYEVERISDMRTGKRTRYGRIYREFLVYWRGYEDPTWVDEADLNCGALLYEFLRDRTNRNRFGAMQSLEEP
ncbi:hypothetical protein PHMEG_00026169, partial [Phytophthora megakarya]